MANYWVATEPFESEDMEKELANYRRRAEDETRMRATRNRTPHTPIDRDVLHLVDCEDRDCGRCDEIAVRRAADEVASWPCWEFCQPG